jgi:hypothetical protein
LGAAALEISHIGAKHDGLTVDQGFVSAEATTRLCDPREFVCVVRAAPRPECDALSLFTGKGALSAFRVSVNAELGSPDDLFKMRRPR